MAFDVDRQTELLLSYPEAKSMGVEKEFTRIFLETTPLPRDEKIGYVKNWKKTPTTKLMIITTPKYKKQVKELIRKYWIDYRKIKEGKTMKLLERIDIYQNRKDAELSEASDTKYWKNDPWGARDGLKKRAEKALERITAIIDPSESMFFYNKNTKHINQIGKQIMAFEKAVTVLEKVK